MHAADEPVGGQHEIAVRRRRESGRIVGKAKRAGMCRERREEARDQPVLGRASVFVGAHDAILLSLTSPEKGRSPAEALEKAGDGGHFNGPTATLPLFRGRENKRRAKLRRKLTTPHLPRELV